MKNIIQGKLYKTKALQTNATGRTITGWMYVVFAALFLLLKGQDAFATHSAGSDMTYRCLGGNQYEIEVTFYRDCGGVAEPANIQVNIKSVNLGQNFNITANKIAGTGQEITVPCQTSTSTCNGGASTGIRKFVYRGTVTLTGAASDWKFSYHVCCRNCSITTIQNPCANSTELYVEATLNNITAPCNSSPTFSNIPIAFVCIGQSFNYNHGVVDANGDSLTYELITPMISATQTVSWVAPASTLNPVSSSTPFTLNAVTGQISFSPNQIQIGIMAIRVKEYRNGQLIGSVIRDMQIYTTACNNNLPTASGINSSPNYQVNACPGQQLCFNISTADADASQTVSLVHNSGISGATYTVTPGNRPSMQFCWTPTEADVSGNPYTFTVTVQDNACPNNGVQIFSYSVFVHGPSFSVSGTNVTCNGMGNGSAAVTLNSAGIHTYSWNTVPVQTGPVASNLNPGTYNVTVTHATGCSLTKPVTITQPSLLNASAASTNVTCDENCDGVASVSASGGTAPYSYLWSNNGTTQQITNLCNGNYSVTVTDANGCTRQSSVTIGIQSNIALASVISDVPCHGENTGSISLDASNGVAPYSYAWSNGATSQNLSGIGSGAYTVTVSDAIGCHQNLSVSVTQPAVSLSAASTSSQPVSCFGGNNGSASVTANGGTSPYSYFWSNSSTTSSITGLISGTYGVVVTDALGCTAVNTVMVNQPSAAVSSTISAVQNVNCFGGNNGSVNLSVAGGTAPYSYNWNNGVTSQDLNNLVSGTYSVTITDANGCTAVQSVTIGQPAAILSGTAIPSQQVSCFSGADGSISLAVAGGTSPYSYIWNNGAITQNLSGIGSGTYTVTVTDANGCVGNASATITQPSAALNASVTSNQAVSCFGGNNGSLSIAYSGGTAPYSFNWNNGATTQNISSLSSGTYTVTITDANSCTVMQSAAIGQPAAALSGSLVSSQNVSCFGGNNGSVNLTVNGGTSPYNYIWNNGVSTQDQSGLAAGTYSVTVTDANGCTMIRSVSVTQPAAALSSSIISSQQVSCFGGNNGAIDLSISGGTIPYNYSWNNGVTTQDQSGLAAGTYSVTTTDANGCTSIQSVVISQPSAALSTSATITQQVSCFGGANGSVNLSVNGGTAPYTYIWSNGQSLQNLNGLSAGNYTVTVTDVNGCTTIRTVTVTQPSAALSAAASQLQAVSCNGGANGQMSVAVNGGTGPYSYLWNNGATTQAINGISTGVYTITVTDANGCTAVSSSSITQPSAALSGSATSISNISCFSGNNGSINLTVAGGTAPYAFVWSTGAVTEDLSLLPAGSYSVTITDANGCTAQASGVITQPAGSLAANLNVSQNVACFGGGNGALDLTVSGGTAPYIYLWNTGAVTEDISGLAIGVYTVNITDANGCISSATGTIAQPSAALSASISGSQQVSCFAGANGSLSLAVNGGTSPYIYNWSNGASSQNINNLTAGIYTVSVTDANGCTTIQSGTVTQPAAALAASVSQQSAVSCNSGGNGSAAASVSGGTAPYTYSWSNGATTQNISNLSAGVYTVNVTDINGCNGSAVVSITEPSAAVSISVNSTLAVNCFGGNDGQAVITANGGTAPYSYNWSNGATSATINGLAAGIYTVTVSDFNGCSETSSVSISQPFAALSAGITASQQVSCFGGSDGTADLTVQGGTAPYIYQWNTGEITEDITGLSDGTYTVTVTDANNCITVQSVTITQPSAALNGSAVVTANISCFSGNNGSIDLSVSGGTAPYNFQWNTGAVTEDVSGLGAGNYTVTITDANGCTTITNAEITQPAGSLAAALSVSQNVLCFAGNTGSLDLTVNGGTAPYLYNWSNGEITEDITGLATGIYTVSITDANGCITSQSAFVNQPAAALDAQVNANQFVSCFGGNNGSVDMNISGGTAPYTFIWSTNETTEDISNLAAGSYTVTVTDANGCTTENTVLITEPAAALSAAINGSINVSCFGGNNGNIDLNITGGTAPYSYNWSNGEITEDISNLVAGTYSVSVTDANGCTIDASVTISEPLAALAGSINGTINVSCFGGNNGTIDLNVNGGTAPYAFNWSNGEITEDLSNLVAGTYSVTVTDANGCTLDATATISEPAAALNSVLTVLSNVNCYAGENGSIDLTVSGGTAPFSFDWSNGETTEDISNLMAGVYIVVVTDANGCETTGQIAVTQPVAPLLGNIVVTSNVFCNGGSNGSLDLSVNGGTVPYTFIWSNGEITEDLANLSTGIYTVTITDANGCITIVTEGIGQPGQQLNASATIQHVLCFNGNNGLIDITPTGGTAPYTFQWNNGAVTEDIGSLVAGIYSVTISDANGCDTVITIAVTQPAAPLIPALTIAQNVSCFGGNNGSIQLGVTGGTQPYVYLWNNGAVTNNISSLPAGAYTVTVTDANGCNAIISDFVAQPAAALDAPLTVSQQVSCFGGANGTIVSNATGGTAPYTYTWNTGATTPGLNGLSAGTYVVTVTDSLGCSYSASAQVQEPSAPLSVNGSATIANCLDGQGGSVNLAVNGGTPLYSYQWSNGSTSQNIADLSPGTYTVTVTDANGCSQIASYIVGNNSVFAMVSGNDTICVGESATLVASFIPGGTYQWYFGGAALSGANSNSFVTPAAGYYTVSVEVPSCGIFFTDSVEVVVKSVENASISADQVICPPAMVQLQATGGIYYEWTPVQNISFANVPDPIVNPTVSTTYSVVVTNEWGCSLTMEVDIAVACDTLLVPNGFSPNDDGTNDTYVIDHIDNYPGNKLNVFNRWGNLIYKATNYDNSWDGTCNVSGIYMGKKVPSGTYYMILDLNDNSKPMAGYLIIRR